jgi:excisionase family DNA binding protein
MSQDQFLDLKALSEYSCLSVRTLRNYLGKLPHYRVGGKLLIRKSEFDRFMDKYRVVDNLDEVVEDILSEMKESA